MTGQLITLPVRLYVRGARLALHVAEDVTGKALMSTLRVAGALGNLRPGSGSGGATTPTRPSPAARRDSAASPDPRSQATQSPDPRSQAAPSPVAQPATRRRSRPAATNGAGTAAPARPAEPRPEEGANGAPPQLASERLEEEGRTQAIDLEAPAPASPDHVSEDPVLVREEAEPGAEEGAGAAISVQEPWEGYGRMAARDIVSRLTAASTAELAAVQLYESSHRKRQTVLAAVKRELTQPGR